MLLSDKDILEENSLYYPRDTFFIITTLFATVCIHTSANNVKYSPIHTRKDDRMTRGVL